MNVEEIKAIGDYRLRKGEVDHVSIEVELCGFHGQGGQEQLKWRVRVSRMSQVLVELHRPLDNPPDGPLPIFCDMEAPIKEMFWPMASRHQLLMDLYLGLDWAVARGPEMRSWEDKGAETWAKAHFETLRAALYRESHYPSSKLIDGVRSIMDWLSELHMMDLVLTPPFYGPMVSKARDGDLDWSRPRLWIERDGGQMYEPIERANTGYIFAVAVRDHLGVDESVLEFGAELVQDWERDTELCEELGVKALCKYRIKRYDVLVVVGLPAKGST